MNDITFNILKIVISVVMALVGYYLVPFIKEKLKEAKNKELVDAIKIAVRAAEQTFKESGMGKAKKDDVLNYICVWLAKNNIKITDTQLDEIDRMIEAAVFAMNNKEK